MVIRQRDGEVQALDYRETAPARATRDMYLDEQGNPTERSITGHLAAGVPGAVAGLIEAHHRYGRLPLRRLIDPAIALARDGFVVDEYRSESIREDSARLAAFPASRASFLPDGAPPAPGSTLRQPDLAATLEAIRDRGADGFYRGRVADLIVAEMARGGGMISLRGSRRLPSDLAGADRAPLSRPHDLLDAAGLLRRRHDGRDPQRHGRLRPAAAVRLDRADASRDRGHAPRLHRSKHVPRRPGVRAQSDRAAAVQGLRRGAPGRDRRAGHADARVRPGRSQRHLHDALLGRGRARAMPSAPPPRSTTATAAPSR